MATVIDALMVTLGIDTTQFKKGAADVDATLKKTSNATKRTSTEMEERGKQAAQFFGRVRNEALALMAVFTAGMGVKNFVANTVQSTAALDRMSSNLKMSAQDLAEWQLAAKNAGGTAEGIASDLAKSADQTAKFWRGMPVETLQAYSVRGGRASELKDGNSYLMERIRIVSDLYKKNPDDARLAANEMGLDPGQFDLYREGPEGIARRRREQSSAAAEQAKASAGAESLRQKYDTAMNQLGSIGVGVLQEMMPSFNLLVDKLLELGRWVIANREQINNGFSLLISGLEGLAKEALKLAGMLIPEANAKSSDPVRDTMDSARNSMIDWLVPDFFKTKIGQKEHDAIRFFEAKGYDPVHAAGIVANLRAESQLDHRAVGDGGQAYGIAQWHPDRQANFQKAFGTDIRNSTLQQQLEFIDWELRNTESRAMDRIRTTTTAEAAAAAVSRHYERPRDADGEAARRAEAAGSLYAAAQRANREMAANAAVATSNVAQSRTQLASAAPASSVTDDHSVETNINGNITVVTQATDAQGMARDLSALGSSNRLIQQGNTGMF